MKEECDKLLAAWVEDEATFAGRLQTNDGRRINAKLKQVVELLRDGKVTTALPSNVNP